MKETIRIIHITTHMGGGVGHAISDLVIHDTRNQHTIILLQKPEKSQYIDLCIKNNIRVFVEDSISEIKLLIAEADIVILHWWHHPIMCKFLYNFPEVFVRLVLWSHISGCTYPMISYQFANKFTRIFFTSKYSLDNSNWTEQERKNIYNKSNIIYGLGELSLMQQKSDYRLKNDKFKIGYVGTLAKSKLHPQFPISCQKILKVLPNAEFYLLGDIESGEWIRTEARELGILDKMHFEGFVDNVNEWLKKFDIFGYPLNPYHFATTENSILEAMSVGLPLVVLNQATEKYIVTHNEDGLLANGIENYVACVIQLAKSEQLRKLLGIHAIKNVYEKFSFKKNVQQFQSEVNKIVLLESSKINFRDILGDEPYNWFLSAVSEKDKSSLFKHQYHKLSPIFIEKTKSSIVHFARSYPENEMLQKHVNLL